MGQNEQAPYEFDKHSLGPTPWGTKAVATVGYNIEKIGNTLKSMKRNESPIRIPDEPEMSSIRIHADAATLADSQQARSEDGSADGWWSRLTRIISIVPYPPSQREEEDRGRAV
jgi:hypothetical protein